MPDFCEKNFERANIPHSSAAFPVLKLYSVFYKGIQSFRGNKAAKSFVCVAGGGREGGGVWVWVGGWVVVGVGVCMRVCVGG